MQTSVQMCECTCLWACAQGIQQTVDNLVVSIWKQVFSVESMTKSICPLYSLYLYSEQDNLFLITLIQPYKYQLITIISYKTSTARKRQRQCLNKVSFVSVYEFGLTVTFDKFKILTLNSYDKIGLLVKQRCLNSLEDFYFFIGVGQQRHINIVSP